MTQSICKYNFKIAVEILVLILLDFDNPGNFYEEYLMKFHLFKF